MLVRDPSKLTVSHERLRIVTGDALNPASGGRSSTGTRRGDILAWQVEPSHAYNFIFRCKPDLDFGAMETHGVRRLVCITGIGAGDSRGHGGFLYDKIIYPWLTKETYVHKDRQESLVRQSSLDWVIVRPAAFTNGPQQGNLRAVTELKDVTIRSISRADTAAFVLEQLSSDTYLRKTPLVGY